MVPLFFVEVKYVMSEPEAQVAMDQDSLGHFISVVAPNKEEAKKLIVGDVLPKMIGVKEFRAIEIIQALTTEEFQNRFGMRC